MCLWVSPPSPLLSYVSILATFTTCIQKRWQPCIFRSSSNTWAFATFETYALVALQRLDS